MVGAVSCNPVLSVLDRRVQTLSNHLQIPVRLCHTNDQYAAITNELASLLQLAPFINVVVFGFATSVGQCPYCSKNGPGPQAPTYPLKQAS